MRQRVRAQRSRLAKSADEFSALKQVQLRILAAALPTRQTRPDRGHRAHRQGLVQPVRMKSALRGKERKVPMLSRAAERPQRVRMVKANHNTGRKKAKRLPRLVRNKYKNLRCTRLAVSRRLHGTTATQRRGYNSSAICTAFSAAPLSS